MGIFNYIDTFFFISLGITFVLILLLVYHFKERISNLEEKNNTMFDIVNNIFHDISIMKQTISNKPYYDIPVIKQSLLKEVLNNPVYIKVPVNHCKTEYMNDDTYLDDKKHYDTDSDTDNDNMDDTDNDNLDDTSNDNLDDTSNDNMDDTNNDNLDNTNNDNLDNTDNVNDFNNRKHDEEIKCKYDEIHNLKDYEENEETAYFKTSSCNINDLISLSSNDNQPDLKNNETKEDTLKGVVTDYKKMNLSQLKSLVVLKGLTIDTSKLKKNELIKILE